MLTGGYMKYHTTIITIEDKDADIQNLQDIHDNRIDQFCNNHTIKPSNVNTTVLLTQQRELIILVTTIKY